MDTWELQKLLFWASITTGHVLLLVRDENGLCLFLSSECFKICAPVPPGCEDADYIRLEHDKIVCKTGLPSEEELRHYAVAIIVNGEL